MNSLPVVLLFHVLLNTFSVLVGIGSFYIYAIVCAVTVFSLLLFFREQFFAGRVEP